MYLILYLGHKKLPGIGSLDPDQDIIMAGSQLIKVFLSHRYYKYHIRINSLCPVINNIFVLLNRLTILTFIDSNTSPKNITISFKIPISIISCQNIWSDNTLPKFYFQPDNEKMT